MLEMILGVGGAIANRVLGFYQSHQEGKLKIKQDTLDKEHELKLLDAQFKVAEVQKAERIAVADAQAQADIAQASYNFDTVNQQELTKIILGENKILGFINGIIRPYITTAFSAVFLYILFRVVDFLIDNKIPPVLWNDVKVIEEFISIMKLVISYWFANRDFSKAQK